MITIPIPATTKASTGAISPGMITLSTIPVPLIAEDPAAAKVEPTTPPINACEDDDGRPKYQVSRFQKIAPISPAKTTSRVMSSGLTMPLAIVAATCSDRNAPTKLRIAAIVTATRGAMARVEIDVATALAVSWNPLVKSNASAVATTIQRTTSFSMRSTPSGVLDDDAFEDVRGRLAGVDGVLEALEDVLPADDEHRVDALLEQACQRLAHHAVALVLEPVDLHGEVADVVERSQPRDRLRDLPRRLVEDPRELLGLLHRGLDAVQRQEVGDLLDEVDDVVHARRERVDVLAVDRRDERRVEALDDVVRDPVALLLADDHVPPDLPVVGPVVEHALEQLRGTNDVGAGFLEQVEELAFPGREQLGEAGHAASVWNGRTAASGHAAARGAHHAPEPLELLRGDPVGVLRPGEGAAAHLLRVGAHAPHHLLADGRVLLDELRLEALVDREQVVQDEHLAVRARAGADADDRHLHELHDHVGHVGRDRLEDDREAAGVLQRERIVEHVLRPLGGAALGAVAAEGGRRLRREADMAHDRHAGPHDRPRALGHRAAALELDGVAARLLDEPVRGGDGLCVGRLVGAERQVADHQRRLESAPDGGGEHEQLLDRDRHRVGVAEHVVGRGVADQHHVDLGRLDGERARVVVGRDHDDGLAQRPLLRELHERDGWAGGARVVVAGWGGHAQGSFVVVGALVGSPPSVWTSALSINRVRPTRAATATSTRPLTVWTGWKESGSTSARYSGSTPCAVIAASAASRSRAASRSPPPIAASAAPRA